MATKILGRFYFKRTRNGNLVGEFSNDHSDRVSTESSDLLPGESGDNQGAYNGSYHSTWQENGNSFFAHLNISPAVRSKCLFRLEWRDKSANGKLLFKGEGMLCDDILIGDYQSA